MFNLLESERLARAGRNYSGGRAVCSLGSLNISTPKTTRVPSAHVLAPSAPSPFAATRRSYYQPTSSTASSPHLSIARSIGKWCTPVIPSSAMPAYVHSESWRTDSTSAMRFTTTPSRQERASSEVRPVRRWEGLRLEEGRMAACGSRHENGVPAVRLTRGRHFQDLGRPKVTLRRGGADTIGLSVEARGREYMTGRPRPVLLS